MKIDRGVVREIRLRLRDAFRTSRGVVHDRRIVIVTLFADGCQGWSECVAGVDASSPETVDGAWAALERTLLPAVLGRSVDQAEEVVRGCTAGPMAQSAIEMAAWDLSARDSGVSLSKKLGGVQDSVEVGVSVGLQPTDAQLVDLVERYHAEGYARIKVKIEPRRDVGMLTQLRARCPNARLWADANAAYTLSDVATLRELGALGLELLEQPLAIGDLDGHARLQRQISAVVCLDESIVSAESAERALVAGACRAMNLKPGRLGGHAETRRAHDACRAAGVPVWCGGMLESGIGRAHNLAVATLPGFTLPGDVSASRRYWERDVVSPAFEVVAGRMAVPTGPGIGVEIDEDYLRAVTVRESVIE